MKYNIYREKDSNMYGLPVWVGNNKNGAYKINWKDMQSGEKCMSGAAARTGDYRK